MSSSFWLQAFGLLVLSHAEKEITDCKAEQIQKMTAKGQLISKGLFGVSGIGLICIGGDQSLRLYKFRHPCIKYKSLLH